MTSQRYNYINEFANPSLSMKLDDTNINRFKVAKEFSKTKAVINSLDFSQDGKTLITSYDDCIVLYDCEKGIQKTEIMSKKYGAGLIRFTHAKCNAIHTSTKENDTIRYVSLHDNKYLRYFVAHEKKVVTLSMSPADDTFISGSQDQTVRLWDIKTEKYTGRILCDGTERPLANYDPEGLIFALGLQNKQIMLYDSRLHDKGPFSKITYPDTPPNTSWTNLKFSPNGKQILITTDREEYYILDAFSGVFLNKLSVDPTKPLDTPLENPCEAVYTPDSQYILCGASDGTIHMWSADKGTKVGVLRPPSDRPSQEAVQCLMFNPNFMLLASGCTKLSFWIPPIDEIQ